MKVELPTLPERDVLWVDGRDQYGYDTYDSAHSDEALRAYGIACAQAALEAAARVCDHERDTGLTFDEWLEGYQAAVAKMTNAIRAIQVG